MAAMNVMHADVSIAPATHHTPCPMEAIAIIALILALATAVECDDRLGNVIAPGLP